MLGLIIPTDEDYTAPTRAETRQFVETLALGLLGWVLIWALCR